METYLMMLYVTLDQESALKTFFADQGWTFCKPDLSVTTDKLGPAIGNAPQLRKDSEVTPGITGKRKASSSPRKAPKIKLVKIVSNSTDVDKKSETVSERNKKIEEKDSSAKCVIDDTGLFDDETCDDEEITDMIVKMKERKRNARDVEAVDEIHEAADSDIEDVGDEENDDTDDSIEGLNDEEAEEKLDGTNEDVKSEIKGRNIGKAITKKGSSKKKTSKVSYRSYSLDAMIQAYYAVIDDSMPIRKAARLFGVPEATLRKRVHGGVEVDCVKSGPKGLFSDHQEAKLIKHLKGLKEKNLIKSQRDIRKVATEYAKGLGLRSKGFLTQQWYLCFQKRWGPPVSDLLPDTYTNGKKLVKEKCKEVYPETKGNQDWTIM